jgi:MFS superfamily sulfate permease-like transporter
VPVCVATVLARSPAVLILRMRRTQQIDFSVLAALDHVFREFLEEGGHVVICGLQPGLRDTLCESPLGRTIPHEFMLQTTREVFGSAHMAIALADSIVRLQPQTPRALYRSVPRSES